MKNKCFLAIFIILMTFNCSHKESIDAIHLNNSINKTNFVDKIDKEKVIFSNKPHYYFIISKNLCFLEILVNDIPIVFNNNEISSKSGQNINSVLFSSGNQKVTIKMYPYGVYKDNNYETLRTESSVKIEVVKINSDNPSEEETIYTYDSLKNNQGKTLNGKKLYTEDFQFDANFPFKFSELETAQVLTNIDSVKVRNLVVSAFETSRQILINKDFDNIARLTYPSFRRQFISEYYNKNKMTAVINEINTRISDGIVMKPLENYEVTYFAGGKLVTLLQKNDNSFFKNKPAIWGDITYDGEKRPIYFPIMLYLPKGKAKFEVY